MKLPSHPHLEIVLNGEVLELTLDRVDQDNRVSNSMIEALSQALQAAVGMCRLIVLKANGPDFCLGRDMPPPEPGSQTSVDQILRDDAAPVLALYDAVTACPAPVLCAVQGRTWGIGMVLMAMADMVVASEDAQFRLRELERGIPPCLAMAPLLDRMPRLVLSHLVLTAGEVDAVRAWSWGLVGEICPAQQLIERTQTLTSRVLQFNDTAVLTVKRYLAHAPGHDVGAAARLGAQLLAQALSKR